MPIYEYQCRKCGKQFEAFQGITEPDLKTCKFCKGKVHKMMSLSSFSLKGSGWYATDYAGKKPQTVNPKSTETATAESSSASSDASATVKGVSED
ncbi:MAG TPA: zinc ribbon domain-containing protein [Smithellaceae bacterium]|jgi:putative FmdB family regulatory protein|nr:zinc ribbon domain-containing protein [Syntrophaceae bacterium]OQC74131.1 MAG: Zinc ribbon domain protein [Deltaproteobacteria bacterium ADurb.Bin002]HNV55928.1 zinc ribbon domain-containing protein [Smithellaceae bacterium]HNY95476.1 zinc ribbon domain-containing protein [Smithellaceae bacterium]HOD64089.1 zinc ribbon domain-containing protein [Smithellaceae bacterium]